MRLLDNIVFYAQQPSQNLFNELQAKRWRQALAANCGLVSFADKEPTLEDVFMLVTKGLVT